MTLLMQLTIQRIGHVFDLAGYVLMIIASLIMWWGIYTGANITLAGGATSHVEANRFAEQSFEVQQVHPLQPIAAQQAVHQENDLSEWSKISGL